MDGLIGGGISSSIAIFVVLVSGALGIGIGHIIFVWCGVL